MMTSVPLLSCGFSSGVELKSYNVHF